MQKRVDDASHSPLSLSLSALCSCVPFFTLHLSLYMHNLHSYRAFYRMLNRNRHLNTAADAGQIAYPPLYDRAARF